MQQNSRIENVDIVNDIKGELFDYALFVGMTSDEYWFGDPSLIYNYINAFELRQEYDLQLIWSQGAYFKSALGSTQLWTVQPYKKSDWDKLPKYAEMPKHKQSVKVIEETPEKKALREKFKSQLKVLGMLAKD